MIFIDRQPELARLDTLMARQEGGLGVVYGRRRIGKTRLLLQWSRRHSGLYAVADQSAPEIQRRYFAEAVATRLPGFADVEYRDWRGLFTRLARDAPAAGWRGPLILDELPYLVVTSPELASVLQRWIDHEAKDARLVVAVAGSSQRMMQGAVLASDAPLYGRARVVLGLGPIAPTHIPQAFKTTGVRALVETYAAWGGVPWYWELASEIGGDVVGQIEDLVLDPSSPLHREPDRLLAEEIPQALETRSVLDAIGGGAHRVSEIAGRLGRPATSMARTLNRLVEMGLVKREVPFGEPENKSRRSQYKIDDPFFRLWFRVVAPHRGQLVSGTRQARRRLLKHHWSRILAQAWEELCRNRLPSARFPPRRQAVAPGGLHRPWGPASRWWKGVAPEWDVVAESEDGRYLLVGEAKWHSRPFTRRDLERAVRELAAKPLPALPGKYRRHEVLRVLFVPEVADQASKDVPDVIVATGRELFE